MRDILFCGATMVLMPRHDRACPVCSTVYSVTDADLRRHCGITCSVACSYKLRADKSRKQVATACSSCSEPITVPLYRVGRAHGRNYCSVRCLGSGAVRDPAYLSLRGAITYAAGKTLPFPPSELALLDALRAAGLTVVHQYVLTINGRSFCADFFIADRGVIIELDTRDTHNRPRIRPRDAAMDAAAHALGHRVVRIRDDGDTAAALAAVLAA